MKKILLILFTFFISICVVKASSISSIKMDITLDEKGNAIVSETWIANVTQGTEGWHPYYNLGDSKLSVISASMDGKKYEVESNWNEDSDKNSKAYKAGIYNVDGNEYDVVFGISEYGTHTYNVVYEITNFVKATTDADMIYWQLFPNKFSIEPGKVDIKISGPNKYPETIDVWGFGKYGALCYVDKNDGAIYMSSDGESVGSDEYFTLLAKFPSGTFATESKLDNNFEYYQKMAEDGAEVYKEKEPSISSKIFIVLAMFFQGFIWVAFFSRAAKKSKINYDYGIEGKKLGDVNNFRDIPCNKDVFKAFFVSDIYGLNRNKNDFMGVLLLKWIRSGNVTVETITEKKLLKDKNEDVITFVKEPVDANEHEINLYRYMFEASGDGRLEKEEFKKWCKNHYSKILGWADKILENERKKQLEEKGLTDVITKKGLIFKYDVHSYKIEETLKQDARKLKGLKQFLIEFSQIDKKEPIEVKLWDEYLMYAQIFGISEQVIKKFKDLYPEIMESMEQSNFDYSTFVFVNSISYSGVSAASAARSAAQSYSAGGGGFSSGGGGGGSFGGGGGGGGFR